MLLLHLRSVCNTTPLLVAIFTRDLVYWFLRSLLVEATALISNITGLDFCILTYIKKTITFLMNWVHIERGLHTGSNYLSWGNLKNTSSGRPTERQQDARIIPSLVGPKAVHERKEIINVVYEGTKRRKQLDRV